MREKKEERSVHVRKNDRGITFVELIIAIAVSTIILGAATLFLGTAQKNYNGVSAQLDLQSESQILMEQLGMWVMEGNRVDVIDNAYATQLVVYQVPRNIDSANLPSGVSRPTETASKRIFWMPKGSSKLYVKKFTGIADVDADTSTVSSTDETTANCIGEYVTSFTPTVTTDADNKNATVDISLKMQYMKQKYEIKNEFKVRNALR